MWAALLILAPVVAEDAALRDLEELGGMKRDFCPGWLNNTV